MKAMVFAAGLGTRLRPLTDDCPKALVTVGGRTLLEIAFARLRSFGVDQVIVNAHHFAGQIVSYLAANRNFGMRVEFSREEVLLDTGGGLKKAAWFFLDSTFDRGAPANEPFIVHNVDVLSTIDLGRMIQFHRKSGALATLAVAERTTSRPLLFDREGRLVRRGANAHESQPRGKSNSVPAKPGGSERPLRALAFSGIHVVSPRIFARLGEDGAFSIIDAYVRLAGEGEPIVGFRTDDAYWRDLGRPEHLAQAERDVAGGIYPAD